MINEDRYQEIKSQLKLLALSISNIDGVDVFELFDEIIEDWGYRRDLTQPHSTQMGYGQQGIGLGGLGGIPQLQQQTGIWGSSSGNTAPPNQGIVPPGYWSITSDPVGKK